MELFFEDAAAAVACGGSADGSGDAVADAAASPAGAGGGAEDSVAGEGVATAGSPGTLPASPDPASGASGATATSSASSASSAEAASAGGDAEGDGGAGPTAMPRAEARASHLAAFSLSCDTPRPSWYIAPSTAWACA